MINIEKVVNDKFPGFASKPDLIKKPTLYFLKHLIHQDEINHFLQTNPASTGIDFIEQVFDYFNFSYRVSARDRRNIPASGRVVIIANHPIGSLDGLALLKLVSEIRPDVRIVANDMLGNFLSLKNLFVPLDNLTGANPIRSFRSVLKELEQDRAVIIFPAGEVSRVGPRGVRDPLWRPGFLHFARKTGAPILPVRIDAKNSWRFYSASMLYKPLSTILLSDEMFRQHSCVIDISVGEAIPVKHLSTDQIHDRTLVKRLKKHLYRLGSRHGSAFITERTVAHPENRQLLQRELGQAELLGTTRDNNAIYLLDYSADSAVMREIGRLREFTFRKIGEGCGRKRDLDEYDQYYRHLVLWDRNNLEIAGAYRIGEGNRLLQQHGIEGFYTSTLYRFRPEFRHYLAQGVELGRSFVNPAYWGKSSLDYLWQGLGAYLQHHPEIRYLFGPVSMSADYPRPLMEELVWFFQHYFSFHRPLAEARIPFLLDGTNRGEFERQYAGLNRESGFDLLKKSFASHDRKIPVLFKQYTSLFEINGFYSLIFSIDPDFGDCLDGLCMADLSKLKVNKRKRYLAAF